MSKAQLKSTALSAVPIPMSTSNRHVYLQRHTFFILISLFCHLMVAFEIRISETFPIIILDYCLGFHDYNLDCKI